MSALETVWAAGLPTLITALVAAGWLAWRARSPVGAVYAFVVLVLTLPPVLAPVLAPMLDPAGDESGSASAGGSTCEAHFISTECSGCPETTAIGKWPCASQCGLACLGSSGGASQTESGSNHAVIK